MKNQNGVKKDPRPLLSTLWVVVMINMLKADILSLFIPGVIEEFVEFAADKSIPHILLGGAVMMEISILMIVLSRFLNYRINRPANIIASIVTILFVVGLGSTYPHYIFIAAVEIICLLLILVKSLKWRDQA